MVRSNQCQTSEMFSSHVSVNGSYARDKCEVRDYHSGEHYDY